MTLIYLFSDVKKNAFIVLIKLFNLHINAVQKGQCKCSLQVTMFIICFSNSLQSNVGVRSRLVSLSGLSVAFLSAVFLFLERHRSGLSFFLSFSSFLSGTSAALVSALLSGTFAYLLTEVSPARLPLVSLPPFILSCSSTPLSDRLLRGCRLLDPSHVFEGARLFLSPVLMRYLHKSPHWRAAPPPMRSSCLCSQGHQGPSTLSKNHILSPQ